MDDDLRSKIRDAFEKEQAGNPPTANLRPDVVRALATTPRRQAGLQSMAIVAAFLLGALVVVGLMSSRLTNRGFGTRNPASSAATTSPVIDYGAPPADIELIWVHDPGHPSWLIGFDWAGRPRATVKLASPQTALMMAPDGQTFAIGLNAKGGNWEFLDRLGRPIAAATTLPGAINPLWADDNKHVCSTTFDQQTYAWTLWTQLPGEAAKQVSVIARDSSVGQSGVTLAACSFRNDTAIAVRTVNVSPTEYWVIKLSSGQVLIHRDEANPISNITGGGDATLLAENSTKSTGQLDAQAASTTTIRRVSDNSVVGTIDGSMGVLAFSADNSTALVTLSPWVGGQPAHLGVVNLATGNVVWQDDATALFGGVIVKPSGVGFALSYPTSAQGPGPATVVLVGGDGSWTKLQGPYAPTW